MADSFYQKIRGIEAQLNRLKTIGLSSSSSLAIKEIPFTLSFQITPDSEVYEPYEVLSCSSSYNCYVRFSTPDSEPALVGLRLLSPTSFGNRVIYTRKRIRSLTDSSLCYEIHVLGDSNDTARLNNHETLPVENYDFKLLTTSNATISLEYVERNFTGNGGI